MKIKSSVVAAFFVLSGRFVRRRQGVHISYEWAWSKWRAGRRSFVGQLVVSSSK